MQKGKTLRKKKKSSFPFTVYRFTGSHYEIGLQHGEAFKRELRDIDRILLKRIVKFTSLKRFILYWVGREMLPYLPKESLLEMEGIARAGEIPFETIYFLNLLPSIASGLVITMLREHVLYLLPDMCCCSTVALSGAALSRVAPSGEKIGGKGIIIGRNLDFGFAPLFQDLIRFAVYEPEGKNAFFTITFPGFIGALTAYSERGIFLCQSSISCSRINKRGIPSLILFRRALETAETLRELAGQLIHGKRGDEFNVFLANRNRAVCLELALRDYRVLPLEGGKILYSANHFQTRKLWRFRWKITGKNPAIDFRQKIFKAYSANNPQNQGIHEVVQLMKKLGKGPKGLSQTVYSLALNLDSLTGLIACKGGIPATKREYIPFGLSGIFGGD